MLIRNKVAYTRKKQRRELERKKLNKKNTSQEKRIYLKS